MLRRTDITQPLIAGLEPGLMVNPAAENQPAVPVIAATNLPHPPFLNPPLITRPHYLLGKRPDERSDRVPFQHMPQHAMIPVDISNPDMPEALNLCINQNKGIASQAGSSGINTANNARLSSLADKSLIHQLLLNPHHSSDTASAQKKRSPFATHPVQTSPCINVKDEIAKLIHDYKNMQPSAVKQHGEINSFSLSKYATTLNNDFLNIMKKFHIPVSAIDNSVSLFKLADKMIACRTFSMTSEQIIRKREELLKLPDIQITEADIVAMSQIATLFNEHLQSISCYLEPELQLTGEEITQILDNTLDVDINIRDNFTLNQLASLSIPLGETTLKEILTSRRIRVLAFNFIQSLPLYELLSTIPLPATSMPNQPAEAAATFINNYLRRLHILLDSLLTSPILIGNCAPVDGINRTNIAYGSRGLSFDNIDQLIINSQISDKRLTYIAEFGLHHLKQISSTGELDLSCMDDLDDDALEILFTKRTDALDINRQHKFALLDAIKVIARYGYDARYDHPQLSAFFDRLKKSALISTSDNNLINMLFASKADVDFFYHLARRADNALKNNDFLNFSKNDLKNAITQFCDAKIAAGSAPQVLSQVQIIERFNKIPQENILHYIATHYNIMIIEFNADKIARGFYDCTGQYHHGSPDLYNNSVLLHADGLSLVDDYGVEGEFIKLGIGCRNDLTLNAMITCLERRNSTSSLFSRKKIAEIIFEVEQKIIAEYNLSPADEADAKFSKT